MNIPEKKNVEVYLNGKWKNFQFIGSYISITGPFGVEYINFIFPENINDIKSWNEIRDELKPVDLINHISNIKWLEEDDFLETYGKSFFNNYLSANKEIEKLNTIIEDGLDGPNQDNIMFVHKGTSINFNEDFSWSPNYEWARRDPDCVILFDEEMDGYHAVYLNESIYHEVIDLLEIIWTNLLKNDI
jgi:hypothetical protein